MLLAHLWLGLVFGGVFALLGLTGSLLVFYPEIDRMLNPVLVIDNRGLQAADLQSVFDLLHQKFPERRGPWRLEVPVRSDRPILARHSLPEESQHGRFAPLIVAVDPVRQSVILSRRWGEDIVTWIYDLHYSLLLGARGKVIASLLGCALLSTLLIGLMLWLPSRRQLANRLVPRMRSGIVRKVYDLHVLGGLYGLPIVGIIVATGIVLATPNWFEPLVERLSSRWQAPLLVSLPTSHSMLPIGADRAAASGRAALPEASLRWIEEPRDATGTYFLRMRQRGEPSHRFPKTFLWIDQYSGEVLAIRDPERNTSADSFFDWLHPLHNGEAFGFVGRCIAFAAGVLPALLFVTGLLRWRQKYRAARVAAARRQTDE
jgi:uncharacterized iron-regulated membrane protein